MVLESIIDPLAGEKHPRRMLYVGFLYSTIGLVIALTVFGEEASLAGIFLTTMPLVIILYRAFKLEEEKDLTMRRLYPMNFVDMRPHTLGEVKARIGIKKEIFLLKEHSHILSFFMFLFIGMVMSYCLWFTVLPEDTSNLLFQSQIKNIKYITGRDVGVGDTVDEGGFATTGYVGFVGYAVKSNNLGRLEMILANNVKVLLFCILFSFLYGSGAVFILTWNASVIGVVVGGIIRDVIRTYTQLGHYAFLYNYFKSFSVGFSFMVHGVPEIASYFLGALAGGIISIAVVNYGVRTREFRQTVMDSVDLIIASFVVLVVAGLIEVYVTPMLI